MHTPEKKVIKSIFDKTHPVSEKSFELVLSLLSYQTLDKGDLFIKRGRYDLFEYFILNGICRSYVLHPEGEEITISFFQGPTVLSPHITRTENDLALLNFQAINEVQVAYFNAQAFLELMIDNLEVRSFANTVLRNELIQKVQKEIGLASMTAKERLLQFRKTFDGLENLVPHPMIASYLGITNISLSRIRSALSG